MIPRRPRFAILSSPSFQRRLEPSPNHLLIRCCTDWICSHGRPCMAFRFGERDDVRREILALPFAGMTAFVNEYRVGSVQ